ncbi:unnamed protein product [Phyllotreta striolata]|uniref:Cell cycle checkpoint protein RAD17 n=1 Tax=Phyllotreta striolata TaxID=444603 RepID=A0A9N9XTC8_PHYSR|nr:unnamed protein product [Phyllotreta striolata]
MNRTKKFKQWESFDFGPATSTEKSKPRKDDSNVTKRKQYVKPNSSTSNKALNFHKELAPVAVSDLAVHPKKIEEVENWLKFAVFQDKSKTAKFLLLTGPTGSGKTATLSVLCKTLGISITEWITPIDQEYEYNRTNQIEQFSEFLFDAKYPSLFESSLNRLTLVEDFPNAVIRNPEQFCEILESCRYINQPIAFICTEAHNANVNLQRTLFPDEVLLKFNINHISFNSCAARQLKLALKRAEALVKSNPDVLKQPSSTVIDAILASADGDIRNAMNQFHMASLLGSGDLPTVKISTEEEKPGKRKRSKDSVKLDVMNKDQSLGLFHGLGRVLQPKRKQLGNSWRLVKNVGSLVDEFSIQPQMFMSFLFENYPKYFGDITDAAKAANILSSSVLLLDNWDRHESLEFALWNSILGLMVVNEHKVSKWNQIRGPVRIVKKDTNKIQEEWNGVRYSPMDQYYHNIIKKSDRCHKFE